MDRDKAQEPLEVPEWVKELFKDVSAPSPTQTTSLLSKDEISLSTASRTVESSKRLLDVFKDSPAKLVQVRFRLVEALITLGLLDEALKHADEEQKKKILVIKSSLEVPDDQFCSCSDDMAGKIPLSRMRVIRRIYHPDHKQMIDVKQCVKCLFTNATDIKTDTENNIAQKVAGAGEGDSDEKVFR